MESSLQNFNFSISLKYKSNDANRGSLRRQDNPDLAIPTNPNYPSRQKNDAQVTFMYIVTYFRWGITEHTILHRTPGNV